MEKTMTEIRIPVFYSPKMSAQSGSFSPSASKPTLVVDSWSKFPIEMHNVVTVTNAEFCRAHDKPFVLDVLNGHRKNGFGNTSPKVASSLRYTSGAMLTAARYVLTTGQPIAAAPCSGFHHAGYDRAGGFCTFNGLMVTATALRAAHKNIRVAILDCDMHYGDGTDDIIERLDAKSWVKHWTAGAPYVAPRQAADFFEELPEIIEAMADCDIVLYQAGADPHIDDPLGGWLTTDQLYLRDRTVFAGFKRLGVPVVWNLAGGYQKSPDGSIPKVLEIHDNTMRACL